MSQSTQSRLEALIEQFADALEHTDLGVVERVQYRHLVDALRIEASLCREVSYEQ